MSEQQLQGFDELSKKLSKLGATVGGKTLRSALNAATKPVITEAKASAPQGTEPHKTQKGRWVMPGFAARNIRKRSSLSKDKRTATVVIGVIKEALYALLYLELGTKHIPKRPWLVKSLETKKDEAIKKFGDELTKKIEKEAKK